MVDTMNTEQPDETPTELVLTRNFAGGPDRLWRLWTDPNELATWFGPVGVHVDPASVVVEAAPGGRWDLDMVDDASGERYPLRATLADVVAPTYLRGIARAVAGGGEELDSISLQVRFEGASDECVLTLRQGPFAPDQLAATREGWVQSFEKIDAILASERGDAQQHSSR